MRDAVPLRCRVRDASGHAVIEFIFVGMLVLVPFTLGAASVGVLQATQVQVDAAAAEAARVYGMSPTHADGLAAARIAADIVASDMRGLDNATTTITCLADCDADTSRIRVRVEAVVPLPLLGLTRTVRADHVVSVGVIR